MSGTVICIIQNKCMYEVKCAKCVPGWWSGVVGVCLACRGIAPILVFCFLAQKYSGDTQDIIIIIILFIDLEAFITKD